MAPSGGEKPAAHDAQPELRLSRPGMLSLSKASSCRLAEAHWAAQVSVPRTLVAPREPVELVHKNVAVVGEVACSGLTSPPLEAFDQLRQPCLPKVDDTHGVSGRTLCNREHRDLEEQGAVKGFEHTDITLPFLPQVVSVQEQERASTGQLLLEDRRRNMSVERFGDLPLPPNVFPRNRATRSVPSAPSGDGVALVVRQSPLVWRRAATEGKCSWDRPGKEPVPNSEQLPVSLRCSVTAGLQGGDSGDTLTSSLPTSVFVIVNEGTSIPKDGIEFDIPREKLERVSVTLLDAVRRLHFNSGHPPNRELERIVRLSGGSEEAILVVKGLHCTICKKSTGTKLPRPGRVRDDLGQFNEVVLADILHVKDADAEGHDYMVILDEGTSYGIVRRIDGHTQETSSKRWKTDG